MSASEKLKALSFWQWRKVIREVVAVVEAAEGLLVYDSDKAEQKLESALAALEEALS